ncbi:DNA-3-methyladenine glycosylase I [Cryobacterium adonitolivorans]|uniref:DNA-3-methyladenine glycosylase I n=1 Tax=Cryobacterium adonitolivorans TaxID=1259189 RepID=A0A4R8W1Q9_9MICO|nr:DNA-3-methyladenine glycosylase I [Cryobacterium adonitolivorans]TFB99822.1 DNA-3-methyladenine glycosylase I [Cryobacterium adonitolivorans]
MTAVAPPPDPGPVPRPSVVVGDDGVARCGWAANDAEYRRYHDEEWGRPLRDEQRLFEKLCLEGFQAGLSWITILRRRPAFRAAFAGFDVDAVAAFTEADVERLLNDERIIRHRGKITATIDNARTTQALGESLAELIWSFAPEPRPAPLTDLAEVPAITPESTALSKALRARGYRFVGPTTMYALMQSSGLVNDHVVGCHRAPV